MSSSIPLLGVSGLSAFYGKSQVVFDVDLRVDTGEVVALLGRNGAGKTSTLLAIAGVVANRSAALRLGGESIAELPSYRRVRRGLALVPSGARSFANLTVAENLEIARRGSAVGAVATIDDVYRIFPVLHELRAASAGTLSGGERQMLAIGRAMLSQPRVLMLDEPSEGLAPIILTELAARLREMNSRGVGILVTEQNHRFALELAERVYFMEKGQIVWEGAAAEARRPDVLRSYLAI